MFGLGKKKVVTDLASLPDEDMDLIPEEVPEEAGADKGGRDLIKIYTVTSSIIVVILGAGILYTANLVRSYKMELVVAKKDYSEIYELGKQFDELLKVAGGDGTSATSVPPGFFRECANESGFNGNRAIREVAPRPQPRRGFVEHSWRVTFNEPLDRRQIGKFLYTVEAKHPLLKATEIGLRGSGKPEDKGDLWQPTLKFAFHSSRAAGN